MELSAQYRKAPPPPPPVPRDRADVAVLAAAEAYQVDDSGRALWLLKQPK